MVEREKVFNPTCHPLNCGFEYADYLRLDIQALLICSKIYLLKGWESSKGATLEKNIAEALGYEVEYQFMIIGITGHARHGKDTTADFICDLMAPSFYKCALADKMKDAAAVIFGWGYDHLYGDLKRRIDPEWGISPRHVLQSLGTEWGQYKLSEYDSFRETTGRLFVDKGPLRTIDNDENAVIADVRFPHEADAIRAWWKNRHDTPRVGQ